MGGCRERGLRTASRRWRRVLVAAGAALCAVVPTPGWAAAPKKAAAPAAIPLARLTPGQVIHGFQTVALYLDAVDKPIGARFRHLRTGFVFDLLQIESVPQVFLWVNTPPTSDRGEPHTQEHLLLGKGNKGRRAASQEAMSLASSSAYTQQWRTCYFFNTTAGPEVFYKLFETDLDALLHPDYTDEEVRREVRNFGVTQNPDGTLRLEEKGTVYNEMVSTSAKPYTPLYRAIGIDLYGKGHPLALSSGGTPEALRTLTPEEIGAFRNRCYYPGNMGMVGAFPKSMPPATVLKRIGEVLERQGPGGIPGRARPAVLEPTFPAPRPAPAGTIQVVAYPDKNEQQPGQLLFAWPAVRKLDTTDFLLLQLFLGNFASDPDTPLYKRFVDNKTRVMETGATGVYAYVPDELGQPVYVGLNDVTPAHLNPREIGAIRQRIQAELACVAGWKDGSPELRDFNEKLATRLVAYKRGLSKFVNSPPGFGFRNTGSDWMDQVRLLEREPGFRKSVLMKPETARITKLLAGKANPWRRLLVDWNLTGRGATPYVVGVRPDAALLAKEEAARKERIAAETARLETVYQTADPQEAIRRYRADYDAASARLAAAAKQGPPLHFVDAPPLTLDNTLAYRQARLLPGGVPLVAATFDTMTSATTTLALRLDSVPDSDLIYLALLPELLDGAGVIENGKALSYEETLERQRREILSLSPYFSVNPETKRYELAVSGAGNDAREARRAVEWMRLLLSAPNWQVANLPRLRDVVDQTLQGLRNTPQSAEENWVNGVAYAYRWQRDPLAMTTGSFLTREHDAFRLRWMLKGVPDAGRPALVAYLDRLAGAAGSDTSRADLTTLLARLKGGTAGVPAALQPIAEAAAALPMDVKPDAADAARDLDQRLEDLPDGSLAADWASLCGEMRAGVKQGPAKTLHQLNTLRTSLLRTGDARLVVVGSAATQRQLQPPITRLLGALAAGKAPQAPRSDAPLIAGRLRARLPEAVAPVFVGLLQPSLQGGVVMNSAPGPTYADTDDRSLLRLLAFDLYAGGGAEGVFMKTWGAGLAYSNGIGANLSQGRFVYYAERTPEVPQTLRFVIDTLDGAPKDPAQVEFALANLFSSRAASGYEARATAMADDLADGITPAKVKAFRSRVLALRMRPDLAQAVYARLSDAVSPILPGYGGASHWAAAPGGNYVIIGSEKQFAAYDAYLKSVLGPEATLYRLYPRDFWMPGTASPVGAGAAVTAGDTAP